MRVLQSGAAAAVADPCTLGVAGLDSLVVAEGGEIHVKEEKGMIGRERNIDNQWDGSGS